MRLLPRSLASCLALLCAAPAALADVLVVAPSGAPFTQINPAVAAAQPGDIVLVKTGTYSFVFLGTKSVSVIADVGATVYLAQGLGIADLQAGKTVVVRGLTMSAPLSFGYSAFSMTNCAGAVRIENCTFTGASAPLGDFPADGASVMHSSQVSFAHCTFIGGAGSSGCCGSTLPPSDGGYGLSTFLASVTLWQCSFRGGAGGDGGSNSATAGGAGALFTGGTTVLDGCTLTGGQGGLGSMGFIGGAGGAGGDGMMLSGGALVRHTDTDLVPGLGGAGGSGLIAPGPAGAAGSPQLVFAGSTAVEYLAEARDLTVNSPVRSGQVAQLEFGVVSCDAVLLLVSPSTQSVWLGGAQGTLAIGQPLSALSIALPCATGTQPFAAPVPALPAGTQGVNVCLQALHSNSTEGLQLGPLTVLTLLDASVP